eukprot:SAG22_NODE_5593_length_988_cov_1.070866_2_plen_130_part_00
MEDAETVPSMQLYDSWREKRVQRFSTGVDRMRARLQSLQEARDTVVEPQSDWAPKDFTLGQGGARSLRLHSRACPLARTVAHMHRMIVGPRHPCRLSSPPSDSARRRRRRRRRRDRTILGATGSNTIRT